MATKKSGAVARAVEQAGRLPAARSPVGDEITRHLRALQAQRTDDLDVHSVVRALVPALATLADRGMLVSLAITPDRRSVRMSALIDKEWVPWYSPDEDTAAELADAIVVALHA